MLSAPVRSLAFATLTFGAMALAAADAKDTGKDSQPPAAVSKEMLRFLNTPINLRVEDMSPALSLAWQLRLADIPLQIEATTLADSKRVKFELVDAKLAEALRVISTKTGIQYRFTPTSVRLAMPEEWKEIDAGKVTFEALKKKEAAAK